MNQPNFYGAWNRAFLVAIVAALSACSVPPADFYEPIPASREFPISPDRLKQARKAEDIHAIRSHMWRVFAEVTHPADRQQNLARFETWYDTDEIFNGGARKLGPRTMENAEESDSVADEGNSRRERVPAFLLFSKEARDFIVNNRLNTKDRLSELSSKFGDVADAFPLNCPDDCRAVVIKTIWKRVSHKEPLLLGVWDGDRVPANSTNPTSLFPRKICVAIVNAACPEGAERVDVSDFYNFAINDKNLDAVRQTDEFEEAEENDRAILVGMHVITREQPDWLWSTFWWHDRSRSSIYAEDRPPDRLSYPWNNYLMTVAWDADHPREADGTPRIAFNPYLEGALFDGVRSNCLSCHLRASWKPAGQSQFCSLPSDGRPRVVSAPSLITRGRKASESSYFNESPKSRLRTGFLWSIALHAVPHTRGESAPERCQDDFIVK